MKNLFLILFIFLLISCGEDNPEQSSSSKNILENFSFTTDTLVVNPGEEIINLSQGVRNSSLDESKTYFYLFDLASTQMNKINLDKLILEEQIPFEKEGPNGIGGNFISTARYLPGEEFIFSSFQNTGVFNKEGEKIVDLSLKPDEIKIEGLSENAQYNLTSQIHISSDKKLMYSTPSDFMEGANYLVKINLENKTGNLIQMPALDKVGEFNIVYELEGGVSVYLEQLFFQEIENNFFLSGSTTNSIYKFKPGQDSLELFKFDFSLVPNEKETPVRTKVSNQSDFDAEMEKVRTQIAFDKLIYDEKTKRYFRFGRIYEPREDKESLSKAQVFLFAFDENLNLIGETEIPELDKVPNSSFFKDGKLWTYVNVEDELGFAVFTFNL
ncbi:DUF4221 family protein [Algoriphagus pacificus]|uniref:DUF4221 family protein n=1 Tax=Algoriphagus pacificus TaxID=2811234 RepID=A0ABS3CCR3_9BACT|nr:DUF4221 family protein [Algoriphagus pacificus]MBN7814334.1 DUF4221 family protein [Algoriphagus pacificus]